MLGSHRTEHSLDSKGILIVGFSILCSLALALTPCLGADVTAQNPKPSQPQLVLEQSILTRAIGIEAPDKLAGLLDTMPSGVIPRDAKSGKTRAAIWSLFFSGSMTKLARVPSPQPFIAFYNPLADVAVIEGCKVDPVTRVMLCTQACAVPGEVLSAEPVASKPRWLVSSEALGTLQHIAATRMRAFGEAQPASSPETFFWRRTYCSPENQNAAEGRLISLVSASAKFDETKFREGAARYLAQALTDAAARQKSGAPPAKADGVITLLDHLSEMVMSGAIMRSPIGWKIFMSEKQNGWKLAVLDASAGSDGALKIDGARFVEISTK